MDFDQQALATDFFNRTCFELTGQEKLRGDDPKGFFENWRHNCDWLQIVVDETRNITNDYYLEHLDEIEDDL